MSGATISRIEVAAAHDGDAELVVTLTYENGGNAHVPLDDFAARALLAACGKSAPDELIGASWERVRDALIASSARYAGTHSGN